MPSYPQKPRPTNNLLLEEARHLRLKKRFSQHFLIRETVLKAICDLMDLSPSDQLLEIGPGGGFLTEKLLATGCQLTAVELDRRMCKHLRERFPAGQHPNFHLVEQDILKFDFESFTTATSKFKVVGNLPYQITSKIMFLLAGELYQAHYPLRQQITQLTVMVQKEVAERICAHPGQRAFNPLSIALQYWFEPRFDFVVPASDFYPPPKVESAVVTLFPRPEPLIQVNDLALLSRLVRTAFAQKRKTIRNALMGGSFASGAEIDRIFAQLGIDSNLRAEAISVITFGELSNAFGSNASQN
jgi:16S rRNA (adenine1518-N6/adenine1519-N6)-dimethyltransferase